VLVLSRKIGERIVVPDCGLSVTIVSVKGNTVRLGIEAPAEIGVYREELLVSDAGPAREGVPLKSR
jgi:carbon storage regulator